MEENIRWLVDDDDDDENTRLVVQPAGPRPYTFDFLHFSLYFF